MVRVHIKPRSEDEVRSSPVSLKVSCKLLGGYDSELASYVVAGFTSDSELGYSTIPPLNASITRNLRSDLEWPDVVNKEIAKELKHGRIWVPSKNFLITRTVRLLSWAFLPNGILENLA